jgi:hypothetical protein
VRPLDLKFLKAVLLIMSPERNIPRKEDVHGSEQPKWIYSIKSLKTHENQWGIYIRLADVSGPMLPMNGSWHLLQVIPC